jgi:predicted RNase H-like nuclease (RuvC/YqgF family)
MSWKTELSTKFQQQIESLQEQIKPLQEQIKPLQEQIESLQEEIESLQEEIESLQEEIESLQTQIEILSIVDNNIIINRIQKLEIGNFRCRDYFYEIEKRLIDIFIAIDDTKEKELQNIQNVIQKKLSWENSFGDNNFKYKYCLEYDESKKHFVISYTLNEQIECINYYPFNKKN